MNETPGFKYTAEQKAEPPHKKKKKKVSAQQPAIFADGYRPVRIFVDGKHWDGVFHQYMAPHIALVEADDGRLFRVDLARTDIQFTDREKEEPEVHQVKSAQVEPPEEPEE